MKLFEYTKANSSLTTMTASLNKALNEEKTLHLARRESQSERVRKQL